VLPIHLLAWETDATLRAAIQQSAQAYVAPFSVSTLLTGGEIAGDARAAGPRSLFTAEVRAHYARALDLGGGAPSNDISADGSASATWITSPLSNLALTAQGSLATTWGIRADSLFLTNDPFLDAQRLEYGVGADLTYDFTPTPRTEITIDGGFAQEGALAADDPAVVGADSRELHGGIAYSVDASPRVSIGPELRYTFTHYEHALLDVDRHRGPADVHATSLSLGGSRKLGPDLSLNASGGLTLASPMPIAATRALVVAPEAGIGLRWKSRRAQLTARYAWSYSSLGPRIGYGQQHTATLRLTAWPFARPRGTVLRATVRAGHGAAPIGADPPPILAGLPPPPITGQLITTTLAGRAVMEIPITRGWAFTSGLDLLFARGHLDPAPPGGEPRQQITGMLTIGVAATVSTDPRRRFPRDPGSDEDDELRRAGVQTGGERTQDRTQIDVGRPANDEP
jgi:hypothetical protein